MADFGDLLGDLNEREHEQEEENTQQEEENTPSLQLSPLDDNNRDGAGELDDDGDDNDNNNEDAEIPAALQQEGQQQEQQREQYNDGNIDGYRDGDANAVGDDFMDMNMNMNRNHALSQSVPSEDFEILKHRWIQELNCAELLPYDHELMEMFINLVNSQDETLLDLQGGGNGDGDGTAENGNVDPTLAGIAAGICKMDMDRLSFLLSDLMRVRIWKIERYWMDLLEEYGVGANANADADGDSDVDLELQDERLLEIMSEMEIDYLKSYAALYRAHMERSVTNHFPKEAWKKIDEEEMIQRPNLDTFCFCRVLDDEGVEIDNHAGIDTQNENDDDIDDDDDDDEDEEPSVNHYDPGSLLFVRYRAIRELVAEGRVELVM